MNLFVVITGVLFSACNPLSTHEDADLSSSPSIGISVDEFGLDDQSSLYLHSALWTAEDPILPKRLILVGGISKNQVGASTNLIHVFDPATKTSNAIRDESIPSRADASLGLFNGLLLIWSGAEIVEGGESRSEFSSSNILFDLQTKKIESVAITGAPTARKDPLVFSFEDEFYVFGGSDATAFERNPTYYPTWETKSHEFLFDGSSYNILAKQWTGIEPFPLSNCGGTPTIMKWSGERIILWGIRGRTGQGCQAGFDNRLFLYSPKDRTWKSAEIANFPDLSDAKEISGDYASGKLWISFQNRESREVQDTGFVDLKTLRWHDGGKVVFEIGPDAERSCHHSSQSVATEEGVFVFVSFEEPFNQRTVVGFADEAGNTGSTAFGPEQYESRMNPTCQPRSDFSLTLTDFGPVMWGGRSAFKYRTDVYSVAEIFRVANVMGGNHE